MENTAKIYDSRVPNLVSAGAGVLFGDGLLLPGYVQGFLIITGAPSSQASKMLASACYLQG